MNNIIKVHLIGREDLEPEVYLDGEYKGTWDQLDILWLLAKLHSKEVIFSREGTFYDDYF